MRENEILARFDEGCNTTVETAIRSDLYVCNLTDLPSYLVLEVDCSSAN